MNHMGKMKRCSPCGQSLVEFALLIPLLLLMVVVLLDLGRAVYYSSVIHNAAREGARYGVVHPADTAGIQAAAEERAVGLDLAQMSVNSCWAYDCACNSGCCSLDCMSPISNTISVTVEYSFSLVTPLASQFISSGTLTLESRSTMIVEGIQP